MSDLLGGGSRQSIGQKYEVVRPYVEQGRWSDVWTIVTNPDGWPTADDWGEVM